MYLVSSSANQAYCNSFVALLSWNHLYIHRSHLQNYTTDGWCAFVWKRPRKRILDDSRGDWRCRTRFVDDDVYCCVISIGDNRICYYIDIILGKFIVANGNKNVLLNLLNSPKSVTTTILGNVSIMWRCYSELPTSQAEKLARLRWDQIRNQCGRANFSACPVGNSE